VKRLIDARNRAGRGYPAIELKPAERPALPVELPTLIDRDSIELVLSDDLRTRDL
jgi:hypothetical protein